MTEGHTLGGLQAPVRDGSTLALGCLHENTELSFLASLDSVGKHVALTGLSKVDMAQRTSVVNVEHVVTTNVSDTASSWPGIRARVAKSPDLDELLACTDLGSINDGVTDEMRVKALSSGVQPRDGNSLGLGWRLCLNRYRRLLLHWLYRVNEEITNSNHRLLGLRLGRGLHVDNGLNLGRSVGGRSDRDSLGRGGSPIRHAVAEPSHRLTLLVVVESSDANTTYGCLELDEWMGVVVLVAGVGLAVLAEIGVMANCTLVTDTIYV
jgi:hypothetical protein